VALFSGLSYKLCSFAQRLGIMTFHNVLQLEYQPSAQWVLNEGSGVFPLSQCPVADYSVIGNLSGQFLFRLFDRIPILPISVENRRKNLMHLSAVFRNRDTILSIERQYVMA